MNDLALYCAITCEGEGFDLDNGVLPFMNESDILVFQIGCDFQRAAFWNDAHQFLARGDNLANGGD